jgi:hypothetical protein
VSEYIVVGEIVLGFGCIKSYTMEYFEGFLHCFYILMIGLFVSILEAFLLWSSVITME